MKLQELKDEEMCMFVAPNGFPQLATAGPDFAACMGMTELLASKGISEHPAVLFEKGFVILPVKVSMIQNGDEEEAFKKSFPKVQRDSKAPRRPRH